MKIEKNKLYLDAYDIDHIFGHAKGEEEALELVKERFDDEIRYSGLNIESPFFQNIKIPNNPIIQKTNFENFFELATEILKYQDNNKVFPFQDFTEE